MSKGSEEKFEAFETRIGQVLIDEIDRAIQTAKKVGKGLQLEVNGVVLRVKGDSDIDLLLRDLSRAWHGLIEGPVGPYPKAELSDEEIAHDNVIFLEQLQLQEEAAARFERKLAEKKAALETKLATLPKIELSDPEGWQSWVDGNQDELGMGQMIVAFTERWARLMQGEIAQGKQLDEIVYDTAEEAAPEGLDAAPFGFGLANLGEYWVHGRELKEWREATYGKPRTNN